MFLDFFILKREEEDGVLLVSRDCCLKVAITGYLTSWISGCFNGGYFLKWVFWYSRNSGVM